MSKSNIKRISLDELIGKLGGEKHIHKKSLEKLENITPSPKRKWFKQVETYIPNGWLDSDIGMVLFDFYSDKTVDNLRAVSPIIPVSPQLYSPKKEYIKIKEKCDKMMISLIKDTSIDYRLQFDLNSTHRFYQPVSKLSELNRAFDKVNAAYETILYTLSLVKQTLDTYIGQHDQKK